jgi:hypothetical protein
LRGTAESFRAATITPHLDDFVLEDFHLLGGQDCCDIHCHLLLLGLELPTNVLVESSEPLPAVFKYCFELLTLIWGQGDLRRDPVE